MLIRIADATVPGSRETVTWQFFFSNLVIDKKQKLCFREDLSLAIS